MEQNRIFAVVETDARQQAAGAALRRMGFGVAGAEETALADYILLPLPLDDDRVGLAQLLKAAKPGALALGGRVSARAQAAADEAGVELIDYFARPELATLNAIPTAEGCLSLLMQKRRRTLWDSAILVVGYGRVGQALAQRLAALGARVTAAARSAERSAERSRAFMSGYGSGRTARPSALRAPGIAAPPRENVTSFMVHDLLSQNRFCGPWPGFSPL